MASETASLWLTPSLDADHDHLLGAPDAPLKLVEYASHTCSHCAACSQEAAAKLDGYVEKGVVSYEIRNQIHDPVDLSIALLARCGTPQTFHPLANQAWQNFETLMTSLQANGAALQQAQQVPQAQRFQAVAEAAGLLDFFAARGISRDQAMQCLANTDEAQQIAERSQAQSDELAISGTPTFFLNGKRLDTTSWKPTSAGPGVEATLQAAGAR